MLINFEDTNAPGYLTFQSTAHQNLLIKTQTDLGAGWTVTFFANYNGLFQTLNDNAGETASQVASYGKTFALQDTNPNAGTFTDFDHIHKKTDMDYVRVQGQMFDGISVDNTTYTYAYVNKIATSLSVAQTASDIAKGITEIQWHDCRRGVLPQRCAGLHQAECVPHVGRYSASFRRLRFRLAYRPVARRRVVGRLRFAAPPLRL